MSVGVDIVNMQRVQLKDSFVETILTKEERKEYDACLREQRKREYLAGHFAAKEAIYKATQEEAYLSYSVLHEDNGQPYVAGHPELDISISHDGDYAIAIAMRK